MLAASILHQRPLPRFVYFKDQGGPTLPQHQPRPALETLESRMLLSAALTAIHDGSSPADALPLNVVSSLGESGRGNFDFGEGHNILGGRSFWYVIDVRFPRPWQLQLRLTQGHEAVTG